MASGSEVSIAVKVNLILKVNGITGRVVSIPDREEFLRQGKKYIEETCVTPAETPVIKVTTLPDTFNADWEYFVAVAIYPYLLYIVMI